MASLNPEDRNYHDHMKGRERGQSWGKKRKIQAGEQHVKIMGKRIGRGAPYSSTRLEERFGTGEEMGLEKDTQVRPQEPWEPLEPILPYAQGMDKATRIQIRKLCSFLTSLLLPSHRCTSVSWSDQNHSRLSNLESPAHECIGYSI